MTSQHVVFSTTYVGSLGSVINDWREGTGVGREEGEGKVGRVEIR